MLRAISFTDNSNKCGIQTRVQRTTKMRVLENENLHYAKFPIALYQVAFMGNVYHSPNSKRKAFDYGGNLYIGPQNPPPVDSEIPYSVFREKANAKCVDLSGKDLSNYSFKKSNFYKADLSDTTLKNTTFEHSNMWGVLLKGAKTRSTNFDHVNFCDAVLSGADFGRNTSMIGANLMGADLRNTDLSLVDLTNALYNETTQLPEDIPEYKLKKMILLHNGSDFSLPKRPGVYGGEDPYEYKRKRFEFAKIRYLTIKDADFANNSFKRADLKGWDVYGCNFKNVEFSRAYAREMLARNCDFSGAKMKQINFDGAEFTDVNMENADLRGAIFTYKSADNLNLEGAKYDQFTRFNPGFNPKDYGMIFKESYPAEYGAKTPEQVRKIDY